MDPIFDNVSKGLCIICNTHTTEGRVTCSEKCHEEFIKFSEEKFGKEKKVVDQTTGISYQVPTRVIIEKGISWKDLAKFPVWGNGDDQ